MNKSTFIDVCFGVIVFFIGWLTWMDYQKETAHFEDKGYRICMHIVDPDNTSIDRAPHEAYISCLEYLKVKDTEDGK